MKKNTILYSAVMLPYFFAGVIHAQNIKTTITKQDLSKIRLENRAKSNGYDRCSTLEYEELLKSKFPNRLTTEQFESWIAPLIEEAKNNKSQNGNIITIPVVVHVIHAGQNVGTYPNITDNQVISQITVLNQDFRKAAGTPGYNTNSVGADVEIQFALAKVDPNGNPTNGIDRVNLCRSGWTQASIDDYAKPQTIWDPTKYLNMWTVEFEGADEGTLGYAQFPSNSNLAGLDTDGGLATTDGVVAAAGAFGSRVFNDGTFLLYNGYDRGRTMTHEVGHWVGLRHIWGDDASPTACATDYCDDTPPAHQANFDCIAATASCTAGLNEMKENYMDYTNDTCMNIFTNDQKTRIRTVMNNSPRRVELKTSIAEQAIPLFANDAEIKIERGCNNLASCPTTSVGPTLKLTIYNRGTSALTSAVVNYSVNGGATQTYNWTGNLTQDKFNTFTVSVPSTTPSGTITASIASVNGTTDQRASNNNASGNLVNPGADTTFNTTAVNFKLQLDYYGTETTWALKNSAGTTLYSGGPYADSFTPQLINQTWNLSNNQCYVFTINDSEGDGLSMEYPPLGLVPGYYEIKTSTNQLIANGGLFGEIESRAFSINTSLGTKETQGVNSGIQIYPNPATDVLNVTKVSSNAQFEIHNAAGQLVKGGSIKNNKISIAELVTGAYVVSIKDKDVSEKIKFIKK